jgi:hypothetical protein
MSNNPIRNKHLPTTSGRKPLLTAVDEVGYRSNGQADSSPWQKNDFYRPIAHAPPEKSRPKLPKLRQPSPIILLTH